MPGLDSFRLDQYRIDSVGGSGNAQPSDVLAGMTFTNDDGEQIGTLIKSLKVATGTLAENARSITNLPFTPKVVFIFVMTEDRLSGGDIYDWAQATGYVGAYIDEAGKVTYVGNVMVYSGKGFNSSTNLYNVSFGNNYINFDYTNASKSKASSYVVFGV